MPEAFAGEGKPRPPSVTIDRDLKEVYEYFRDFTLQPNFVKNFRTVEMISPRYYKWRGGKKEDKSGETKITAETPQEFLAWKTSGDAEQIGAAIFESAPGGRGTMVSLVLQHEGTLGQLADLAAKRKGEDLKTEAYSTLRRLKALLETGEVPTIEGQPSGREEKTQAA